MERPRERRHTYAAPTLPGGRLTVDEVRCALGDPSTTPPRGPSRCGCVGGARLVCCRWCSVVGPRCCSSEQPAPARRCSSCGRAARLARRATRPPPPTTTTTNDDDDDDTNTHTPRVWLGASGASPPTTGSTTAAAGSMPIDSHTKTRSSAASFQFSERA